MNKEAKHESSSRGGKTRSRRDDNPFKDPEWQKNFNSMTNPEIVRKLCIKANSPEAIEKKKATWKQTGRGKGTKNSQFGTCWVTHSELGTEKISKDDLNNFLTLGYTKGRKIIAV